VTKFKRLYDKGYNYSQIAKQLGISDSTAQEYGASHGMKARPKFYNDKPLNDTEF
jgi:transposase